MAIAGTILFWILILAGIAVIPFGIAGTFLIVADVLVYGLVTGFRSFPPSFVGILLAVALSIELLEAVLGAYMARRFGGSRWAMIGAVLGGVVGAVVGTPILPVVGTLAGAFVGAFVGAAALEFFHTPDAAKAIRAGLGAFFGTVGGKMAKLVAAIVMAVLTAVRVC